MEKPKKPFYKRWWVWVLAVIIVGAIASGGGEDSEPASTEPKKEAEAKKEEPKKEEKTVAKIGQPLKVGDVTFTVYGTSTAKSVGPEGLAHNAQGTFLIIDVGVKNGAKEALTIDSSFFKLKANGAEYEADVTADTFVNDVGGSFFLKKINPGNEGKGKIVFDVPADVATSKDVVLNVQTGFFGTEQGQIQLTK
ncbi:DUF4352 domain-containing protein [Geobacillus subterraneus]|uniref:DUF4352 domain-containing protein n=1 Tax=Geobacillus subterraneus TaxID=129338 RepID=A0A679FVK9_9BACL|nr:DUF4352 domain-containing protein [Geobacillus subterraneus]BBW98999.1 hypothetical protein GsuE55_38320 [Geobacillus subterraneus]